MVPSLLRVAVGLATGARLPAVSVFPARDAVLVKYAPVPAGATAGCSDGDDRDRRCGDSGDPGDGRSSLRAGRGVGFGCSCLSLLCYGSG